MPHRYLRAALTVGILGLTFAAMLWMTMAEGTEYYKHVDEVVTHVERWHGRALQLHGFVVPGSILIRPGTLQYRFKVENNGSVVDAAYEGVVPDTFKDGAEVVLKGRLTADGFRTDPNGVMAKCPSKYAADSRRR